ncbi:hypothetical protein ABH937_005764 [Kitasatospora sp. GAS1066B]
MTVIQAIINLTGRWRDTLPLTGEEGRPQP